MDKKIIYTGVLGTYYGKSEPMKFKTYSSIINLVLGSNTIVTTLVWPPRVIELFNSDNEQITGDVSTDYDLSGGFYRILIDTTVALSNVRLNVIAW